MNTLLRKALHAEVTLVRVPLKVFDERVVARYTGENSRVRQTLQVAIGVVDQAALALSEPVPTTPAAATRPAQPGTRDDAEDRITTPPAPGEPMPADELEQVEELAAELIAEQEDETFAGELADDDELRRVQAELQAKHRVEEVVEESAERSAG